MPRLGLSALLLALVLLYAQGLDGPLVLDDRSVLDPVREAVARGDGWAVTTSATGQLGRPVAMLSFIADSALSGGSNRVAKAVNVALHLVNTLLVWLLARGLLARAGLEARWTALWIAGLWALLPLHVSTVLYTVQRMTLLSASFVLCGLIALLAAADRPMGRSRLPPLAASALCLVLASLAKENGVLLLPLAALLLLYAPGPTPAASNVAGGATAGPRLGLALAGLSLLGATAGLLWFLLAVLPGAGSLHLARGWTPFERLALQTEVLWLYVAQILLPLPRFLPFFHDDRALDPALGLSTLVAGSAWLLLMALALSLRRRGHLALAGLGLFFFLVGHALESTVLPLELVFEHRNYLPSLGIVLAAATLALHLPLSSDLERKSSRAAREQGGRRAAPRHIRQIGEERAPDNAAIGTRSRFTPEISRLALPLALLPLPLLAATTFLRVADWGDERRFALRSYQLNPEAPRAASQLAALLAAEGDPAAAVAVLEGNVHPGARLQALYTVCMAGPVAGPVAGLGLRQGLPSAAGLAMDGYATTAAINLSDALHEGRCALPELGFVDWLATAVEEGHFVHQSEREKLSVHVAHGLRDAGRHAEAMRWAEERVTGPTAALGRLLAADWRSEHGDCPRALENLRAAADAAGPRVSRGWETMVDDTRRLLAERGCTVAAAGMSAHGTRPLSGRAADSFSVPQPPQAAGGVPEGNNGLQSASLREGVPPLPACGERAGVRGFTSGRPQAARPTTLRQAEDLSLRLGVRGATSPHPCPSPRARGEGISIAYVASARGSRAEGAPGLPSVCGWRSAGQPRRAEGRTADPLPVPQPPQAAGGVPGGNNGLQSVSLRGPEPIHPHRDPRGTTR